MVAGDIGAADVAPPPPVNAVSVKAGFGKTVSAKAGSGRTSPPNRTVGRGGTDGTDDADSGRFALVSGARRPLEYLLIAVTLVAGALLLSFHVQQQAALKAAGRTESAVTALTAMLDQETGVRGYLYTGQVDFLEPYLTGRIAYAQAREQVAQAAHGDATSIRLAAAEDSAAASWQQFAAQSILARREGIIAANVQVVQATSGKAQMDQFRALNAQLRTRLNDRRDAELRETSTTSTIAVMLLAAVLALFGYLRMRRRSQQVLGRSEQEVAYRVRQREFSELIQAVDSEAEAHELVQRHLQRSLPGASATVLTRNNSDNRLQPATDLRADSVLHEVLADAEPRSCLAIRLGRPHQDGTEHDELISCKVCRDVPGTASCQPLLVGGKVIGAVLVEGSRPLEASERRSVTDTVEQAAPVLANLKTIAIAESRAATDALTGLPNRRAMQDTMNRMAAHASRTARPLAAIAFDLDHFKGINDRYGHDVGDIALSAVGECLRDTIRESDFAARIGGEEFLVLCPDTGVDGASILAEKLRDALHREEIPHLLQPLTASFGIAVVPDHAASPEILLRRADRACYLAKERGRNRVEVASGNNLADAELLAPTADQPLATTNGSKR